MIFSLPFIVVSVFASLVKLVLSLFIEATLVFYARYSRDEYASSIRWSRTGGLLEMTQLLWCSYRLVPRMSNAVLVSAMVVSFSTLFVSSILTVMVSRTDMEGSSTAARAFTTQLISMDLSFWIAYLKPESTVEETLTTMLTDTRRNPNANPRTRYTPRTYAHEAGCGESTAIITRNSTYGIHMPSKTIDCKAYIMQLASSAFEWDPMTASLRTIDSSTFMAVAPVAETNDPLTVEAIEPFFFVGGGNRSCIRVTFSDVQSRISYGFPKDGMMTLPKTDATKCQYGADGSLVFSVTYFQFVVGHMKDFENIAASILDDPTSLPLLKPMIAAINEGAFASPTNNSSLVMLTKIPSTASDVDFFMCKSKYQKEQGEMGLLCTYMLTSVIIVSPQAVDPTIAADLKWGPDPFNSLDATNQLDFTIFHLPQVLKSKGSQKITPLFSSARLVKATADATQYLASLGHNIHMYKDPESIADKLYILYDAVELKDAYEVSTAAFAVVCVLTGLFGIIWASSAKFFPTVYNSTLHKTIYKELNSKDESVPMLMHCTHDPLAFDGNQVGLRPDDQPTAAPETSSEDHPMVSLQRRNNVPNQQQGQQPLMLLDEIPAQSPLMSSWSIAASPPVMSPATAPTTATPTSTTGPSRPLPATQLQPYESTNLGVAPSIPPRCPRFAHNIPFTSSVSARLYGATTHAGDQTSVSSTRQGPALIQSPFE
ncbi:hypothetical protein BGZ59_002519 [Podila verticillata]|nr:hypothetical protein BGZ59_002519 [Podila verticillata]KFH63638.1 hypothetical protein MVEG_10332 [Podila verticillata NRRL 6337]